jgi:hypothetical protein
LPVSTWALSASSSSSAESRPRSTSKVPRGLQWTSAVSNVSSHSGEVSQLHPPLGY